jgi:hypothetical protein
MQLPSPRLDQRLADPRLGQVVDDEAELGQPLGRRPGRRQLPLADQQVVGEPGLGDRGQPLQHLAAEEPRRVGLVVNLVADPDQGVAAGCRPQRGHGAGYVGGGQVDPADHTSDAAAGRGHDQELLGLLDVGDRLHDHGLADPVRSGGRVQVLWPEAAPERRQAPVHPRVGPVGRVPEVVVGIDAVHHGVGTWSGSRPSATSSVHRSAGTGRPSMATASCTSAAVRAPTSTLATAGWPNGKARAAARNGTPWLVQTAWRRPARSTNSGGAGA